MDASQRDQLHPSPAPSPRVYELFRAQRRDIWKRTDRLFIVLMLVQWVAGIVAAMVISPRTWVGSSSQTHIHVYAAIYLGGIITAMPVAMALLMPGAALTRHTIAVGQMLFSSLLIHLSGGRIETHFHVFGSLAFLAAYRDWRVLLSGSLVVVLDHFFRGLYWPQSVYGIVGSAEWRFLEHAGWVLFEDIFLMLLIHSSLLEMWATAERQALLESAMQAVESADRAKSSFLAHMSHEIRTPMTAILGYADVMAAGHSGEVDANERAEAVEIIRRNGTHLLTVLNDILDISKIEAGRLEIEHVACSPAQIVCEAMSLMRPRAAAKGLTLKGSFDTPIPQTIQSDPTRLRQVLINLLSNAIKFTDTGQVKLSVKMQGEQALAITVADTGIGMTDQQRERLFQPFTQADQSTSRRFGGTGLGLVISKRLAEKLGGDIVFDSTPGRGSAFTVTIATGPLEGVAKVRIDAEELLRPEKPGTSTLRRAQRATIHGHLLLAEDSTDNRLLLKRFLEKFGLTVQTVENGADALRVALDAFKAGRPFDLILMDMQMPLLDGYSATTQLRASGYTGRIMALTAHASEADRERCLAAGCDEYVAKPFDPEKLLEMIEREVATHRRFRNQPALASSNI